LRGVGTAWLPLSIVDDDLARGSLCRLSVAKHDLQLEIRVYRTRASATEERSALVDRAWTAMITKP
jgi:hypothetical protein